MFPAKKRSSAIAMLHAYPLPGDWSMSTGRLLAVCSCAADKVILNVVKDIVAMVLILFYC
jgi:hypothetical protein